ncbi:hypothetical protein TRVA0_027S01310 [Trichomonascus vanleenenianus]|uniref:cyclin family protein n=1 Tax=Trichomonascus vanleenenianus TaxID=2268995 RepID=UPI003EC99BBB
MNGGGDGEAAVCEPGTAEWPVIPGPETPSLNEITAEQALGYLNQALVDLISVHETLPTELDVAASIVKEQELSPPVTPHMGPSPPDHHKKSACETPQASGEISPFGLSRNSPLDSRAASPEVEALHRRRARSSLLNAEATVVASVVDAGHLTKLPALKGRMVPVTLDTDQAVFKLAITRRFWSKTSPPISTWKYLCRLHHYCPNSTAVYLSAAVYIFRLCVVLKTFPLTTLCVHRLVLAAIRVAAKSLEDNLHVQKRFAIVGGVEPVDLYRLEIALLFLIDFDLKVDSEVLEQCLEYMVKLHSESSTQIQIQKKRPRSLS